MTPIRYNEAQIKANPLNRDNARHIVELLRYAQHDLQKANAMPHATAAQRKIKDQAINEAQTVLDIRAQKYHLYKKLYPDLIE